MPLPWKALGLAALACGALAYPVAWALDRSAGDEFLVVTAADAASVEANRGLWELNGSPKAEIPSIYGTPTKAAGRIVFPNSRNILRPKEDPALALFLLQEGEHPLQAQTLYYLALPAAIGGILAGVACLVLARRAAAKAGAPAT